MRTASALPLLALLSCGPSMSAGGDDTPGEIDAATDASTVTLPDGIDCPTPPTLAGADVQIAPQYASLYTAYDLGTVPGVPNPLGGATVHITDDDKLLIAGNSENGSGAIYEIGVNRNACGHIIGFVGTAQIHATTPYVDANLVYVNSSLMLYTQWPTAILSQLPVGASTPARNTDLRSVGLPAGDSGPGGIGMVPPGLAGAGGLRMVTWPGGYWVHLNTTPDSGLLAISGVNQVATVPNNPGGFAYVPAGSPGFAQQAIIMAEWVAGDPALDRVAVYDVDAQGDPVIATRREFMTRFPRPWGAYFEPVTGDYFFLSWGTGSDRVFVVQGFAPPPPID